VSLETRAQTDTVQTDNVEETRAQTYTVELS